MKTRMLGSLAVSEIGFGTMSFTGIFGEAPDRGGSIRVIPVIEPMLLLRPASRRVPTVRRAL